MEIKLSPYVICYNAEVGGLYFNASGSIDEINNLIDRINELVSQIVDNPEPCPHISESTQAPAESESPEANCKGAGTEVSG